MKKKSVDYLFVAAQFILLLAYFLPVRFYEFSLSYIIRTCAILSSGIGVLIALMGVLQLYKQLSPYPSPTKSNVLITNGLFSWIRHPVYTGIILVALGYSLYAASAYKLGISLILYVLFYFKSKYEEKLLLQKHAQYTEYKKCTGRFFPKLW